VSVCVLGSLGRGGGARLTVAAGLDLRPMGRVCDGVMGVCGKKGGVRGGGHPTRLTKAAGQDL